MSFSSIPNGFSHVTSEIISTAAAAKIILGSDDEVDQVEKWIDIMYNTYIKPADEKFTSVAQPRIISKCASTEECVKFFTEMGMLYFNNTIKGKAIAKMIIGRAYYNSIPTPFAIVEYQNLVYIEILTLLNMIDNNNEITSAYPSTQVFKQVYGIPWAGTYPKGTSSTIVGKRFTSSMGMKPEHFKQASTAATLLNDNTFEINSFELLHIKNENGNVHSLLVLSKEINANYRPLFTEVMEHNMSHGYVKLLKYLIDGLIAIISNEKCISLETAFHNKTTNKDVITCVFDSNMCEVVFQQYALEVKFLTTMINTHKPKMPITVYNFSREYMACIQTIVGTMRNSTSSGIRGPAIESIKELALKHKEVIMGNSFEFTKSRQAYGFVDVQAGIKQSIIKTVQRSTENHQIVIATLKGLLPKYGDESETDYMKRLEAYGKEQNLFKVPELVERQQVNFAQPMDYTSQGTFQGGFTAPNIQRRVYPRGTENVPEEKICFGFRVAD